MFALPGDVPQGNVYFFTKLGMVKLTPWSDYTLLKNTYQAIKLKEDDEVIAIETEIKGASLVFTTAAGMCLRCFTDDIPEQGRISAGVKGIKLADKDFVLSAQQSDGSGEVAIITDKGFAKRIKVSDFEVIGRYSKGVKLVDLKNNGKCLVFAQVITEQIKPVLELDGEYLMCVPTDNFKLESRTNGGKPLVKNAEVTNVFVYGDRIMR